MTPDARRASRLARNEEHEPEFYVLVTEAQALDLASGYVPSAVQAMCRTMLEWMDEDQRRAARPVRKRVSPVVRASDPEAET